MIAIIIIGLYGFFPALVIPLFLEMYDKLPRFREVLTKVGYVLLVISIILSLLMIIRCP